MFVNPCELQYARMEAGGCFGVVKVWIAHFHEAVKKANDEDQNGVHLTWTFREVVCVSFKTYQPNLLSLRVGVIMSTRL